VANAGYRCPGNVNVTTCAKILSQGYPTTLPDKILPRKQLLWKVGANGQGPPAMIRYDSVQLEYTPTFGSCIVHEPKIEKMGSILFCNTNGCGRTVTFSSTQSYTQTYGYEVGLTVTAQGTIGVVGTSVSVSTSFSQGWEKSTETSEEISTNFDVAAGRICAIATVQIKADCFADIKDAIFTINPRKINSGVPLKPADPWSGSPDAFCARSDLADFQSATGTNLVVLCDSLKDSRIPSSMFVNWDVLGGKPWSIDGCMFNEGDEEEEEE